MLDYAKLCEGEQLAVSRHGGSHEYAAQLAGAMLG